MLTDVDTSYTRWAEMHYERERYIKPLTPNPRWMLYMVIIGYLLAAALVAYGCSNPINPTKSPESSWGLPSDVILLPQAEPPIIELMHPVNPCDIVGRITICRQ